MAPSIRERIRRLVRRFASARLCVGQVIQEREQEQARQRLLDQAEQLRGARWQHEPWVPTTAPSALDERVGGGRKGRR